MSLFLCNIIFVLKADLPPTGPIKSHQSLLISKMYVLLLPTRVYYISIDSRLNYLDPDENIFNEQNYTSIYYTINEFNTEFEDLSEEIIYF